jgi:hypothetical protein
MLNVVILSVVMLSVVMLSVVMLSVVMLNVVMLSVVAAYHSFKGFDPHLAYKQFILGNQKKTFYD